MITVRLLKSAGILLLLTMQLSYAKAQSKGIVEIDKALTENKYDKAEALLTSVIDEYYTARKADSLVKYIFYVGKVAHKKTDADQAVKKMELFVNKIKSLSPPAATLRQTYIEAGEFYGSVGKNTQAYKANQLAYEYTAQMPAHTPAQFGLIENNLSTYAQRMADLNLSQQHGRRALQNFLADPKPHYEGLYIAYNGMGSTMWYGSKTDSALYYFKKALEALEKTERTPLNQFYRPAVVQNNLAGLYGIEGKTTEAINAMKQTINNVKSFLATKEPHIKKSTAVSFQFEATDNLAGIYKELGDLKQAKSLLEYSYQQKQKLLPAGSPAIFISQILLGQLYYATKDFDKSLQFLNSGLNLISKADGDYLFWQADACNTLALLHDEKDDNKQAAFYYEKADSLYEESLQGDYDNIYLDFLRNAALFYAENNQPKIALAKATKGYNYVVKTQGAQTLIAFYQLLNLSQVHYLAGNFREAVNYSNKGLEVVNKRIVSGAKLLDSVQMELQKPKAILWKNKAEYQLLQKKDVSNLSALLKELNEALTVLERRKSVISDPADITLLMADHSELLEFVKKINLDLFNLTKDQAYIDRLMSLHESGIYNRIRSRLDKNDSVTFAHIPESIQIREKQLKAAITASLEGDRLHEEKIQRYFKAVDEWNRYLETLKANHPRYYKMRYASIFKSLGEIQKTIPANTSLVRYFFVEKELFAVVADSKQKQLYPLQMQGVEKQINELTRYGSDAKRTGDILFNLYGKLWAPFATSIHHKKVVIVPAGILYNLNFELLTPQKITRFEDLATKSLLATLTMSYQYSMFLLSPQNKTAELDNNFVAFAPGFTDRVKNNYRQALLDSSNLDNTYLSLLPQPFTISLATTAKDLLGGRAFINDQSTAGSFKKYAGMNKIIHIGTHAESNNLHPEFSRLIFAKNPTEHNENNSLYLFDLYNCDLTSNLTVLTACESGKPGYQDGEGMISLAHAFSYAGSESIVTGLWKIDEQSSALLMDLFYENLLDRMPKDEALRQAKLGYLAQSKGRSLAPQYWAGLVLIGDTSPVDINKRKGTTLIFVGLIIFVIAGGFFIKRKLE